MGIKKVIVSTSNSLKLLRIGELTPFDKSTLTPVSEYKKQIQVLKIKSPMLFINFSLTFLN